MRLARPRRVCRQCKVKRCKDAKDIFCSVDCYRASRRKSRGRCCVCKDKPVARQSRHGTCGRTCGGVLRWRKHQPAERRRIASMWALARANFLKRLAARLKEEAAAVAAARTPEAIAKALARVYRKGYANGASAAYYRHVTAARRAS